MRGCTLFQIVTHLIFEVINKAVTGKFLLRKFHLGKFHLENSSYGKFLLWKNNIAGNSGMPLSVNL